MPLKDKKVGVPCPVCGTKIQVALGEMKPGHSIKCPKCGGVVSFGGKDLAASVKKLDAALRALPKKIR